MHLDITIEENGSLLSLKGRLDALSMEQFEQAVKSQIEEGSSSFTLDFAELVYISSGGLRVIMNTVKILEKQKRCLVIRNAQPNVYSIFVLTGFDKFIEIFQLA
jgi:anti-anti-sigma factor